MRFKLGKKGDSEEIAWPQIIFTILLLAFTVVFFIFAKNILNYCLSAYPVAISSALSLCLIPI